MVSCGNNSNHQKTVVQDSATNATYVQPRDLQPFDSIEKLFQNDNWLVMDGKDSSYLYCSRLGKAYVKTYYYKMYKGDSVNTMVDAMQYSGNAITWHLLQDTAGMQLTNYTADSLYWKATDSDYGYYFIKTDNHHIVLKCPGGKIKNLVKTPALSSFLVRSKYDYLHGTKLAFSDSGK